MDGDGIKLRIPFYHQRFEFTCGPASLMMAMKYIDNGFQLNRKNEMDIWRESSLAPLPPTIRYGLAFSALKRGFRASILTNVRGIEYVNKSSLESPMHGEEGRWLMKFATDMFKERKERAFSMGLKEKPGKVTLKEIRDTLIRNGVPIFLTSAKMLDKADDDWAHWAVVSGIGDGYVRVNNPALEKGRVRFPLDYFQKAIGYHGDMVLISIFKK
jgi:hypothetical protein